MRAARQVAETNAKYEALIAEFKEVHQQVEALRKSGFSSKDIKEDMLAMDQEKDQITKRIERIRRKVGSHGAWPVACRLLAC